MPIRPSELARHLARGLEPAYAVVGDETLLVEESCDAILARARAEGFVEREIIDAESDFDWGRLAEHAGNLSLFAARRVVDLRLGPKAFGKDAVPALEAFRARSVGDTVLVIRAGRPAGRADWVTGLDKVCSFVQVWPLAAEELTRWLAARAQGAGLKLEADALAFLVECVEGNLLAASQEIQKLALLELPQPIALDALRAAVMDASRFDAFDLVDAALEGDPARAQRILFVLREEGMNALAVVGPLAWSVRTLAGSGAPMAPNRARAFEAARRRLSESDVERAVLLLGRTDRQVKGAPGDPWRTLETLALLVAGVRLPLD
jgi:DNA polymerase-3 subunit delta